jgi:hypothetical protein
MPSVASARRRPRATRGGVGGGARARVRGIAPPRASDERARPFDMSSRTPVARLRATSRTTASFARRDRATRRASTRAFSTPVARADEDEKDKENGNGNARARGMDRRRALAGASLVALVSSREPEPASAKLKGGITGGVPIENFKPIPGTQPPILYYDLKGEAGTAGGAPKGSRVALHYDLKFRSVTVGTSRQGAGVTGGNPIGFTVGQPAGQSGGPFIKAFNEGIKGMGVGTLRRMIVPPEYAYGPNEVMEIPPNATVTLDMELLSVAKDPLTRQIAVEGQ